MIKLLNILNEGAIQLTPNERQQVEEMLPDIIEIISGKYIGENKHIEIREMEIVSADGTPMKVKILVGSDPSMSNSDAYYQTVDRKNPNDNYIFIQQRAFSNYFKGLSGADVKLNKFATGDENAGIDALRRVLKHEIIHAKDPAANQHYRKEPYDLNKEEVYYKSWVEFQTMTGQFFEAITTSVDRALESGVSKDTILKALDNILQYYSGKVKFFTDDTNDFLQGTRTRSAFQSLIKFASSIVLGSYNKSSIQAYASYIQKIKQYNPEGYQEFLTDLYKTVDQAKDKLKTIQEMTPSTINESMRMQKLAGLLAEAEDTDNVVDKVEDKLEFFDDKLKAFAKSVKPSPKDGKLDEAAMTIAALIAGAPGLLTFLGRGANFIGKAFGGSKDGNVVGKALIKAGHKLEHSYIDGIAAILTGFFPEAYANQNQHDESSVLHDHCHAIYAAIVGAAAIASGIGASHATGVVKALEVGATGLKSSEVIALAQKIAAA